MIRIHRSNRLEVLADALGAVLDGDAQDPFAPHVVLVHSTGMERWLAMTLAERSGVCANVDFRFPLDWAQELLHASIGSDPSAWSRDRLIWPVTARLPEVAAGPGGEALRAWLAAEVRNPADAALSLAIHVATVFERYEVYRPDLARAWTGASGDDWQSRLWHAVATSAGMGPPLPILVDRLLADLTKADLPLRLALFSVGTLPPLLVDLFTAIGTVREVHLFALSASGSAWERHHALATPTARHGRPAPAHPDDPPLLMAFGRLSRDLQVVLETSAPMPIEATTAYVEPGAGTLLHALQSGLMVRPFARKEADDSVQVHACHGDWRQVEVVRDVILKRLDADPTLDPRHVVVMAPDVDRFGPIIDAVFSDGAPWPQPRGDHAGGLPQLPFAIGDRGAARENPVAAALMAMLGVIGDGRFEAPAVLDLLAHAPVRLRFKVEAEQLPAMRRWVADAGIRWGIDREHRVAWDQPDRERFTWRAGLDRLLVGQATASEDPIDRDEGGQLQPVNAADGQDARMALGGLADLAEVLFEFHRDLSARSMAEWSDRLLAFVDRVFAVPDDLAWQVRAVRDALIGLADRATGFDDDLSLRAVVELLEGRFAIREAGRAFLGGGVTVCELVPMRSIPFRVVCLIGMDEGAFPREGTPEGFDLVARDPRLGDRSPRDDDRGLMLDTLLAAREALVITYSAFDGAAERPPAVPVQEVLDALGPVADQVVVRHPLQSFSPRAFDAQNPWSPDRRRLAAALAWQHGRVAAAQEAGDSPTLPPAEAGPVALADLRRAVATPCDAFVRRLRLSFWEEAEVPLDREPLFIDDLGKWHLRDDLLGGLIDGSLDRAGARTRVMNDPLVPLGNIGKEVFEQAWAEANLLADQVRHYLGGAPSFRDVEVDRIYGRIHGVGSSALVVWMAGNFKPKRVLDLWVDLLALSAADPDWSGSGVLVAKDRTTFLTAPDDPAEVLADLVALGDLAVTRPLPFVASAAHNWARKAATGATPEACHLAAQAAWRDDAKGATLAAFGSTLPEDPEVGDLALRVWAPILPLLRRK